MFIKRGDEQKIIEVVPAEKLDLEKIKKSMDDSEKKLPKDGNKKELN